ncbi:hypothetical protein ABIB25_004350 [Nakamurella sp. UYEF19]|uniref:DUF4185 domain-containing protein n=1 Tax=Nakamurella sp. UYEF19 TaxID=1756392 RepID=UPI00339A3FEC
MFAQRRVGVRRGQRPSRWIGALAGVLLVLSGCSASPPIEPDRLPTDTASLPMVLAGVDGVHKVSALTGPDSPNRTDRFEVAGQDLGSMFEADGRIWFVFGDTFGQRDPGMTGGGGDEWRSNALAYSTDRNPADGITLDGYTLDSNGSAAEPIPGKKIDDDEMTIIPTYGFAVGATLYLAFMSVRHWGDAGEWETNYAGLARSKDKGATWQKLDTPRWGGNSNFVQVSVTDLNGELYFWGVTHGRFGGVQLMKVASAQVEQQGAYQYFTGTDTSGKPLYSNEITKAKTIVAGTVGELSVVWNDYLDRWLMTSTDGGGAGSTIREAAAPWGPWSAPITLVSATDVPGVYAPYMLADYVGDGGRTIYFTLSVWDPYNVFVYRADLRKTG